MRWTTLLIIGILALPVFWSSCFLYGQKEVTPHGTILALPSVSNNSTAKVFTIIVESTGFNGTSGTLSVSVNQGDIVTINFLYGDWNLSFDNPHMIAIEGYGITTGTLDRATPTQTLTFIVGQPGQFQFHCILPCYGMQNLQQGVLVVNPHCQNAAVPTGFTPIIFDMRQTTLVMLTNLTDQQGNPVAGVIVDFFLNTDFGEMLLGHNATDWHGTALMTYTPSFITTFDALASFAGTCNYEKNTVTGTFQLAPTNAGPGASSPYIGGQNTIVDSRLVGVQPLTSSVLVGLGLTVVGSVWAVLAYVILQTLRISRRDKEEGSHRE